MLSGVDPDGNKRPILLGHFFLAIKIEAFIEPAEFRKTASALLKSLRDSKKAPGQSKIYTAGEKEYLAYQERLKTGVPIPLSLKEEMDELRELYNLTQFKFPWDC
jgi:LDH2 family malate/lactate/ureidoglycolate dehydrogenase